MPVYDFITAIDDIKTIVNPNKTMVVFTGGEPLLRNDLELCGMKLFERGFPWGIVTNGFSLSPERLMSLLKSGLHAITVSLDGLEETHNWLRGNNSSYIKALNAIDLLANINNLKFDIVTCVTQRNINELALIKQKIISKGVKEWRLFTIAPIGRAKYIEELQLSSDQFNVLLNFIANERQKNEIKINFGCEGFLGDYEGRVRDNLFFCRAGINVASVLIDGSISACPNLRENYIQGNIYSDSFSDIWQNRFADFRNREWMRIGDCKQCEYFKFCDGGSLHLREKSNGNLMFCHLKKMKRKSNPIIQQD